MDLEECSTCVFYDKSNVEQEGIEYEMSFGICRRFPPQRIDGMISMFPVVDADSWCGEYQEHVEE